MTWWEFLNGAISPKEEINFLNNVRWKSNGHTYNQIVFNSKQKCQSSDKFFANWNGLNQNHAKLLFMYNG